MVRPTLRRHIAKLDPARDCAEIMRLLAGREFPWDYQRSMVDMVFMKGLAAPRIAGLIASRGYIQAKTQKRYDDTAILIVEFVKQGFDSERGAAMIARMNQIHARFRIRRDDYLYVLTGLMFEPIRWNTRFGWRRLTDAERLAHFHFWREVGKRMDLDDVPPSYEACESFNVAYEREQFRRTTASVELSRVLFGLLESWVPRPVRPLVRPGMSALVENELLDCFDLPHPPRWLRAVAGAALRLRARSLRWLPGRAKPSFYVDGRLRSYPDGYAIGQLGPPADWQPANRHSLPPPATSSSEKFCHHPASSLEGESLRATRSS